MAVALPSSLNLDIQSLEMDTKVDLYEIDMSSQGQPNLYFHSGRNELGGSVFWQGMEYSPWPMEVNGISKSVNGPQNRPTMTVANIGGAITGLNADYDDLIGCKLIRHSTLVRFLDPVNFEGGVNPDYDPTAEFPLEMYFIDRKEREDEVQVTYALATILDLENVMLPARVVIRNVCPWKYRGGDCGYAGPDVADIHDNGVGQNGYTGKDACGKRLSSCKLRFGEHGTLPFGGFPASGIR